MPTAAGPWVPLTANVSEVRTITKVDGSVSHEAVEGVIYRMSNGTEMYHFKLVRDGKLIEDSGAFIDNTKLRVYKLDYLNKTLTELKKLDTRRLPEHRTTGHDGTALPEERIDGVDCVIFPVVDSGRTLGKMWVAKNYEIPIKYDYTYLVNGITTHIERSICVSDRSFIRVIPTPTQK